MPKLSGRTVRSIRTVINTNERQFDAIARIAGLRPEEDFRHMVLREVDFSGSNLDGFDFTGCYFKRCSFVGARIGTALLHGSDFEETDPSEALDWEERWHHAVTGLTLGGTSTNKQLNPDERGIEDALRQLEEYWSEPDWPLLFRRNWLQFRPDQRMLALSQKWLDASSPPAAAPLLLTLVPDSTVPERQRDRLVKLADAVLHRCPVELPSWIRLWIALLELPGNPSDRLQIGTERLCDLTVHLPEGGLSRRQERAWVTLWSRLNQHQGCDPALLEEQARRAAGRLRSSDFAARVLHPMARDRPWARKALRRWLFRTPLGRRGWAQTLARYLKLSFDPDVRYMALEWLTNTKPGVAGWPLVWEALASEATNEDAINIGVDWLLTSPVVTPRWADVLVKLLALAPDIETSQLQKRAAEWLRLNWSHPEHALICAFVSGQTADERSSPGGPPMEALRNQLREAAEHLLGAELREVRKNRFVGADGYLRAAIRLSKRYPDATGARYWYSYYASVDEFLSGSSSYLLLGCMDRDEGYAVPTEVLRKVLPSLHKTPGPSPYWHIHLVRRGGQLVMVVPKEKTVLDLEAFRVSLRKPRQESARSN